MALTEALKAHSIFEMEAAISEAIENVLRIKTECGLSRLEFAWNGGRESAVLTLTISEPLSLFGLDDKQE